MEVSIWERTEDKLKNRYSGATVWQNGKLVMKNGWKDQEWWKRKVGKVVENIGKYKQSILAETN